MRLSFIGITYAITYIIMTTQTQTIGCDNMMNDTKKINAIKHAIANKLFANDNETIRYIMRMLRVDYVRACSIFNNVS